MTKGETTLATSLSSQAYHFLKFIKPEPKKQKIDFKKSMLITSIDIDVGNRQVAILNSGRNDLNVNDYLSEYDVGAIEESVLPLFLDVFDSFNVPVTLAVRGKLFEVGESAVILMLQTSVKHDIGAHGYSHKSFQLLARNEAEKELDMLRTNMKKFNIIPQSFIFPKNRVAHLDLLEKYGYKCYREYGDFMRDGMYITKRHQLYDVHPSFRVDQYTDFIFLKAMLNICIRKKLPFHLWFHLWNFGNNKKSIQKTVKKNLVPFFKYAEEKADEGLLSVETMISAVEKLERVLKP